MQYSEIPGVQGLCPTGWHIPTQGEFTQLRNFLGGDSIAGGLLKEVGFQHWNDPNTGATNETEFTALGSGFKYSSGSFANLGIHIKMWSSSISVPSQSWFRYINNIQANFQESQYYITSSFSARCIKN